MGAVLAIPIGFVFYHILTTEDLKPIHGVYNLPNRFFYIKKIVSLLYLKIQIWAQRKRFDLYDMNSLTDMEKNGFIPPPKEIALENPQPSKHLLKKVDEIFFYGVKSTGECLVVKASRLHSNVVEVMMFLRTDVGNHYTFPNGPVCHSLAGDCDYFSGGGLKIKCVSAMRKWRILFNGFLREIRSDSTDNRVVHVKFSFIWQAMSDVQDMICDINQDSLAEALAKEPWDKYLPDTNRLNKALNNYEQGGQLQGTVSVEGQEKEFILWGTRIRNLGQSVPFHRSVDFFGFLKKGGLFHVSAVSLPGIVSHLVYGHYIHSNAVMMPIRSCNFQLALMGENKQIPRFVKFSFVAGGKTFKCVVDLKEHICDFVSTNIYKLFKYSIISLNEDIGCGISVFQYKSKDVQPIPCANMSNILSDHHQVIMRPMVVEIDQPQCYITALTGGKGSSLAKLTTISKRTHLFHVPPGVVVTTVAYQEFIKKGQLQEVLTSLEEIAWGHIAGNLKEFCQQTVTMISRVKLPETICRLLHKSLQSKFGDKLDTLTFAVRSSASGEDSDDMSAAGQNDTFLGIKGLSQIYEGVTKCWASQFSYLAIEYKRRNGQLLNSPMAVVIQQMIPADVAGVMFTCDPVTSNPAVITITANYGLGETVVSGTAEPDTILLDRDYNNKISYRSVSIGKKNLCTVVEADGEIKDMVSATNSSQSCLSESSAIYLGHVGVLVEKCFASLRDIEWAMVKENIYLLQARSITSTETETEFEIIHENDSPLRSEHEFFTKANIGEVIPGAISPLGMFTLMYIFEMSFKRIKMYPPELLYPYLSKTICCRFNHAFFSMLDNPYFTNEGNMATGYQVSFFGRPIRNREMAERSKDRLSMFKMSLSFVLRCICFICKSLLQANQVLQNTEKRYSSYDLPVNFKDSLEMYKTIEKYLLSTTHESLVCHMCCTSNSQLWNAFLLNLLVSAEKEWNVKVFSDFGYLLSTCTNVESADIPNDLRKLALEISKEVDNKMFIDMTPESATRLLRIRQTAAGKSFREFVRKHGHRCLKELDINSIPWRSNSTSVVQTLQCLMRNINQKDKCREEVSSVKALLNLQVSLSWWQKYVLKFLLPRVRNGVQVRERSKSLLVKTLDVIRRAYCHLGTLMMKEGRLPDARLLFFLTHQEIGQLLHLRSPRLISKAIRRQKVDPLLNSLCFSEITQGIIKPIPKTEQHDSTSSYFYVTGTPVSQGIARGPVRVVTSIDKADEIQPGDILVTYGTDIGWSPYFPLLSGVATELGGLISHGAVVAREYGLPCVIGLHGATSIFKSGEMVQLDGNRGRLEKILD
ncbi:uncharacterized protein LOC106478534 [Limulus polyphemus]|uniref:Uncharacterized protein LOC106478534 n=1 Tax=Limulus polyphemus TaxID=6850 RepID=A0ABM1C5G5_LIMPO|nr:uncharacterized protein LOC106478534 [Limulus polyphemus]